MAESLPDVQGLPETENGLPGAAGIAGAEIFFSGRSGRPFFLLSLWGHWG